MLVFDFSEIKVVVAEQTEIFLSRDMAHALQTLNRPEIADMSIGWLSGD